MNAHDVQRRVARRLSARIRPDAAPAPLPVRGRLTRMVGLMLEAGGVQAVVGARCVLHSPGMAPVEAEVVGFSGDRVHLMPLDGVTGLAPGAEVVASGHGALAPVGEALLGRVLDGAGRPLDGRGPLHAQAYVPLTGRSVNPLARRPVREPLSVGVRAIDALLTVGRGQRLGLFAGSGVGKSVLLGMMTRHTEADVTVVGLIGERGREVADFVRGVLGAEGLRRAVVVAAPADAPPLQRLQGAMLATTIAEYFRDRGQQVLLLMDSLTRFAQAQRELALAVGEPPATRGYPPSVFARLPALVERAGTAEGAGAVTAFYTVLTEGDDPQDPVADAARAILDGHILLSRELAESGHYPAIEVEASVSRVMADIVPPAQLANARRFRRLWSAYRQQRDLIAVGAYQAGADPLTDAAVARWPALTGLVRQDPDTSSDHAGAVKALAALDLGGSP